MDVISLVIDGDLQEKLELDQNELVFDASKLSEKNVIESTEELKKYNSYMKKIPKTRKNLNHIKWIKDLIIHDLIDKVKPPLYLKLDIINYRAIITHYLLKFTNKSRIVLKLEDFIYEGIEDKMKNKLEEIFCGENNTIIILTSIENIFHLMDFKKDKKTHEYLGDILYEKLKIHDTRHVKDTESFKAKIASLPWLLDTLKKPDLIYDKDADLTEKINPDLVFVRNTGNGSEKEKYMHHYVALTLLRKKTGESSKPHVYQILSQFGLQRHTNSKMSYLYKKVKINEEIYKRK